MSKLKNLKKFLLSSNETNSSYYPNRERDFDENQLRLLTEWLDELNQDDLITLTDDNDIVIRVGGQADLNQQIFIYSKDIDNYMSNHREHPIRIQMSDLARILLQFEYVKEISGQLVFPLHSVSLGYKANIWLKSIIENIQLNERHSQIDIRLFNGKHSSILSIPYEYLSATTNIDLIVEYLIKNGQIQYNVQNQSYIYHYIEPDLFLDKQIKTKEKQTEHQLLSYHILNINIDQLNQIISCQFRYENNSLLHLSNQFYKQISKNNNNRHYIIDLLISNGKFSFDRKIFTFLNHDYYLLENQYKIIYLSINDKRNLFDDFLQLIIEMDCVKYDENKQLFVLENPIDLTKLYFTNEDSILIRKNSFKKQDVLQILVDKSLIKKDQLEKYYFFYNEQFIQIPNVILTKHSHLFDQNLFTNKNKYQQIIDYMYYHQLITFDKKNSLIKLHFTDQTLLLPINHLDLNIDQNNTNSLPFTSEQLANWLINNSYLTKQNSFRYTN